MTATPAQVSLARELRRRLEADARALTEEERDLALGALARLRPIDPFDLDALLRAIHPDLTFGARYGAWHGVCAVVDAENDSTSGGAA